MNKKWIYNPEPEVENVKELGKAININPYLSKILIQRGIETFDKAKHFFRPSLSHLHDPFEMLNMETAVHRLTKAISSQEKILLYGDYDVDGTTSVSLMYLFLSQFSNQLGYYIPDRYAEGYGISKKGIDYANENGFTLVIALDCGIRAIARARHAKALGIDLIICDHHLPGDELPEAFDILNPNQSKCKYPFKSLSGCGVGFKFLEGFCQQNAINKEDKLYQYLDIVAVSIACDIVSIVGENRTLAFWGLKKMNQSPSKGLKSLIETTGKKNPLSISDVVFSIGPRINAAGRISHARESVKVLIHDKQATAGVADSLNHLNIKRRAYDQIMTSEALEMIAEIGEERKSTVLFKASWRQGIVGIVASRCIEHYYRPTIILTQAAQAIGKVTGSARSVEGFDIYNAISKCSDLLDQYGGHTYAAGLTLPIKNVERFIHLFEEVVSESILPEQLIPKVRIETDIPLSVLTFKMYQVLQQMAPFGPENMTPVFSTKNVVVDIFPKIMKEKHIKGFLHAQNGNRLFEFIGFGMREKVKDIKVGRPFHIAYHLEENNYLGDRTLILNLKDVRFDV